MSDILLPQSPDAEKGLLSSFVISPKAVGCLCVDKTVTPEHFASPHFATIYGVLREMWVQDHPIDFITLTQELRDQKLLEQVGGAIVPTDLFTYLPTAANAEYYAEILEEKLVLRRIISVCTEHGGRAFTDQDDFPALLAGLQEQIMGLGVRGGRKVPTMKENVVAVISALQEGMSADSPNLIRTGLKAIDEDVGPLERGNMLVIGGQGKAGKSQLAGQILLNIAFNGQPVLYISLEMTEREITSRWLASMARVNMRCPKLWSEADYSRFDAAKTRIIDLPLTVLTGLTELPEIVSACRQHAAKPGPPLAAVVLDYAQLTSSASKSRDDRKSREIADISRTCKRIAVKHNLLFILLTQLNDDGRAKESRDIENDANLMLEVGHNQKTGERGVKVILARSAPMGQRLALRIIPEHTRVEDGEPITEPEHDDQRPTNGHSRGRAKSRWPND